MKSSKMKLGEMGDFNAKFNIRFGESDKAPALPDGDPYADVEYTGDPEADTAAELDEYQKACKENIRNYSKTIEGVFDSEFFLCVCFQNRDAKEDFLKEFHLEDLGDKYIDGGKLAKIMRKK